MTENPFLSVVMITYGHEKFIEQAINGVFKQKTDFPVEFIIANDCSPDNSDEIIKQSILKAPENIAVKYTRHEKNLGMMPNFVWALKQAKGKYIAYFEGDDHWTDPKKIQIQVNFLESNPDYSIICHNLEILEGETLEKETYLDKNPPNETSTIVHLARRNIVPTLTAVFRNQPNLLPRWILDAPIGDLPLFMNVARHGKIKFLNRKMAVYRKNVGVWNSMKNEINSKMIAMYDFLINDFKDKDEILKNLKIAQAQYKKEYLKSDKISFISMLKTSEFRRLAPVDKIKLSIKKFMA